MRPDLVEVIARALPRRDFADNWWWAWRDDAERVLAALKDAGYAVVPVMPTEEMWGGLARQIVTWTRNLDQKGKALHEHLRLRGTPVPEWLAEEIPDDARIPPKGTVAAAIYRAMLRTSQEG